MKVHCISCGPAVNDSERQAIAQLKTRMLAALGDAQSDDHWLLLTNLSFSATHRLQSDEIDIIAIGPPGIRVIEVKHWTAAWVNRNPGIVEREADRATLKARKIGSTLRQKFPSLPRVDGVFLVTEAAPKVKALQDYPPVRGVTFHTFKTWRSAVAFDAPSVLFSKEIQTLGRFLQPRNAVAPDGQVQRLAGYISLKIQTHPDERFHRIYKGTHASRQDRVVLHLYDLSVVDEAKAAQRAEREWKSLHRLQLYSWAPRIVDSFQDVPGYTDEMKFFTLADPDAPSIKERTADEAWDTGGRLRFARNAVRAVGELHEAGMDDEAMVHRNLTANTILVKHDNKPILTGFEYARIPAESTVVSADLTADWDSEVAPEIQAQGRGASDRRSDIYSLCASLMVLFQNREDEQSLNGAKVLARGMEKDPKARTDLAELEASIADLSGDAIAEPQPLPARFWTEDQIIPFRGHSYRIVSRLGSGGVGTVYKVVKIDNETQGDLGTYVAKVARDEATGRRVLNAYERVHSHLHHSALSTIFEVALEWQDNNFVALMTWIDGSPLGEYTGVLSILAEDLNESAGEALALRWLRTACEALDVLHRNGFVHGDLSPRNMIVSGADLVLTDYDCVTKIGTRPTTPGTVPYCSPSCSEGQEAAPSDDIYALAASFFNVLFEQAPFEYDGVLAKERGLNWDSVDHQEFRSLTPFLDQATNPNPAMRFATATDAMAALDAARRERSADNDTAPDEPQLVSDVASLNATCSDEEPTERRENEVPWLQSLLQSYPGSRWGNAETRGLDSQFAISTYVETNLEQTLYRAILERRVRLAVLCGNAGDGKTALLQHLARRLGLGNQSSATRVLQGTLEDGLTVRMNLDGSASWKGQTADQLLDEFLAPFQQGLPNDDCVHLLAINDGRLLEWIEKVESEQDETPLTRALLGFLEEDSSSSESHIRFVNLNERSLVGGVAPDGKRIDSTFLDRLTDSLYGGERATEIWAPCKTCLAQEHCEVYRATRIFGPETIADEANRNHARQRLFHALKAVHLCGETHITVRELRATLVYILFGIHDCRDYHSNDNTAGIPDPQLYSERAFSPMSHSRQGEVLRELVRFDPALEAHPQIDRRLLHPRSIEPDESTVPRYDGLSLEAARRRAYFEWPVEEIQRLTGDAHAFDLARGSHLRDFLDLAKTDDPARRRKLTQRLCAGISRLETLPPQALDRPDVVPLRVTPRTPTETAFWVEKRDDRFRLEVDFSDGDGTMERLHREAFLIFSYRDGREEKLRLGAELFHLLLELSDGYQLGDVATDDTFAHLSIFVQRLVQEDDRRMFAWNPMQENAIFEISANLDINESDPRQRIVIERPDQTGVCHVE